VDTNKKREQEGERGNHRGGRFVPPSKEEVQGYVDSVNYSGFNVAKFHSHYTSVGWKKSGGARIVDWKATADLWHENEQQFSKRNGYHDPLNERMVTIG
jgi:hypothetical protein